MNIKTKILIPAITLTLVVAAAILISNIILFSESVDTTTFHRVETAAKVEANTLDSIKAQVAAISLSIAENPAVLGAILNNDRNALLAHATQALKRTDEEFCVITDSGGRVIMRTHEPENYGDLVTSRNNIASALAGKSLAGIESGSVIRLSVRAGAPVFDEEGKTAGVVSVGYRLDTERFVDSIKEMLGCEATLSLGNERVATTILNRDGTRAIGTNPELRVSDIVLAGNTYTGQADILGRAAVSHYTPLVSSDGQVIGMMLAGIYNDDKAKTINAFVQNGLIITFITLAVFSAVILFIVNRIVAPVRAMTKAASALASGDTNIDIRVNTNDEMRTFADAFRRMVENTGQQVEIVEQIAAGGLTTAPRIRSEKDVMNRALEKLNATIRAQAAAIREEHERVRIMLDATPLVSRLWDRNFKVFACNEAAVKLFGLKDKQEYLDKYFDLSPEYQSEGQLTVEKIRRVVAEAFEKGSCTCEWMYRLLDGTSVPCENTLVRVPYGDDYAVAAYSRDLRAQKRMVAEIEQRDTLLQIVNHAIDLLLRSEPADFAKTLRECMGIMASSIHADRMYLHKNYVEDGNMYNIKLHEWVRDTLQPDGSGAACAVMCEGKSSPVSEMLRRGESVHSLARDLPHICRECLGVQNVLSIMLIPVFIRNEFWGFVGFDKCRSEDLFTENEESVMRSGSLLVASALLRNEYMLSIKDTSEKLEAALADAKEANNAKSSFLARMSHEIRTPLNAVIGFSELTLDEGNLGPEAESNLEKICSAGSTILSIVNDILDISKIESGKFEISSVQYDTPSLINDLVMFNIVRVGERPINFKLQVDENLPCILYGDDIRVKQIFNNLLSNAFKYTESGTVEWRMSFERDENSVWLVSDIEDTGIGIKPDALKKLFSEYNQVDAKSNRKVEGTGLGLAITKRLVEMMDGTITVESEYGKGSVFRVRLRQAPVSDTPIGKSVAANLANMRYSLTKRAGKTKQGRVNLSYAHVLVVDDVATNLDVVKGMLKPYKVKVDCAVSGRQAVNMISSGNPRYSAVFMDHMMPGMDGIEAVRIIREEIGTDYARNIPVIALTANAIAGNDEMFLSRGFQGFVSKPIDMSKLDSVLRQWVRDKNLEEALLSTEEAEAADGNHNAENESSILSDITINGVDIKRGLKRFDGSEKVFIDVLRSYVVNTPRLMADLKEYFRTENPAEYSIVIHGIKGASYSISAREVGNAAETLEKASKAGNMDAVKAGHADFEKAAETLIDNINTALNEFETTKKPGASVPDPGLLRELWEACRKFDMDRIDSAMARLESFNYESGGKLIAWLREQIDNATFEAVSDGEWPEL